MEIKKTFSFGYHGANCNGAIEEPSECPVCKNKIKPQEMACSDYKNETGDWFVSCMYLCNGCYQTFIVLHEIDITERTSAKTPTKFISSCRYVEPNKHKDRIFPTDITTLNSSFQNIYNQALAAEDAGLTEICGMGYRKALEFLVKDYLVHVFPEKLESIRGMELGNCIANLVPINKIKTAASRCAWIGNDLSHYYQKHENLGIYDLKKLLDATVYWISMELATEAALLIEKA